MTDLPILTVKVNGIQFEVYRAGKLYDAKWLSCKLRDLVFRARESYNRYGKVPLNDALDRKSAVYITRVSYLDVEEWLSMRFVPGDGVPEATEDLQRTIISKGSSTRNLVDGIGKTLEKIVTISRICVIRPYSKLKGKVKVKGNNSSEGHHVRNKYSGMAFLLMNKAFFEDAVLKGYDFQVITALMHRGLTDKILTIEKMGKRIILPFADAKESLKLSPDEKVILNRENAKVRYQYPGYFLDINDLVRVLKSGVIPKSVLKNHIDEFEAVIAVPKMNRFKRLGELLLTDGKIRGAKITGERLRKILDREVKDGPILRIMDASNWKKGIEKLLYDF